MIKISLVCIAVLFVYSMAYTQLTVKIVTYNEPCQTLATFEVLKSDSAVKNGTYTLRNKSNNKLITEGFFKNNLKDSAWTDFDDDGKTLCKGYYKNGKRYGIWEFSYTGELANDQYNFNTHTFIHHETTHNDRKKYKVIAGADTFKTRLDRAPVFIGGYEIIHNILRNTFWHSHNDKQVYPLYQYLSVSYIVAADGHLYNFRLKWPADKRFESAALQCYNNISGYWLPGVLNNQPVNVEYDLSFYLTILK